ATNSGPDLSSSPYRNKDVDLADASAFAYRTGFHGLSLRIAGAARPVNERDKASMPATTQLTGQVALMVGMLVHFPRPARDSAAARLTGLIAPAAPQKPSPWPCSSTSFPFSMR